jgi:hypothetical protein
VLLHFENRKHFDLSKRLHLKNNEKHILYLLSLFFFCLKRTERQNIAKTNAEYAENKFVEAEANYRISVQNFQIKATAPFNLGNTIYKQKQSSRKFAYAKSLKIQNTTEKHRHFITLVMFFMKRIIHKQLKPIKTLYVI